MNLAFGERLRGILAVHLDVERWHEAASALEDFSPVRVPLDVLLAESVDLVAFVRRYWEAGAERPGLSSVADNLGSEVGEEILSLRRALQGAREEYRWLERRQPSSAPLRRRALELVREMRAVLEWHLGEAVEGEVDPRVERLRRAHRRARSGAALAQALHDYATLAEMHARDLHGQGGFDVAVVVEAFDLAGRLGGERRGRPAPSREARAARELRDRLAYLLYDRVRRVRAAVRFVFRHHPEIVRQATSAYERRRRRVSRKRRQKRGMGEEE